MTFGIVMALMGAAIASTAAGIGSALGVSYAGYAASGVLAEEPKLFGRVLILQALSGTQGIYGLLIAVLILNKIGLLSGTMQPLTAEQGFVYLAAGIPIGLVGLMSAIFQGRVSATAIMMTAKRPELSARGIMLAALVETYAILALLVSFLIWNAA